MKKSIFLTATLVVSMLLFSFKSNVKKEPTFIEISTSFENSEIAGKFTRVTYYSTTSDRGTWERYKETWDLVGNSPVIQKAERILNKY